MGRFKRSQIGVFISLVQNKNLKIVVAINKNLDAMKLVQSHILFTKSSKLA